jgi:hypothetical protein
MEAEEDGSCPPLTAVPKTRADMTFRCCCGPPCAGPGMADRCSSSTLLPTGFVSTSPHLPDSLRTTPDYQLGKSPSRSVAYLRICSPAAPRLV